MKNSGGGRALSLIKPTLNVSLIATKLPEFGNNLRSVWETMCAQIPVCDSSGHMNLGSLCFLSKIEPHSLNLEHSSPPVLEMWFLEGQNSSVSIFSVILSFDFYTEVIYCWNMNVFICLILPLIFGPHKAIVCKFCMHGKSWSWYSLNSGEHKCTERACSAAVPPQAMGACAAADSAVTLGHMAPHSTFYPASWETHSFRALWKLELCCLHALGIFRFVIKGYLTTSCIIACN